MSEMSFEQMLEESLKTIRNGEVVEGTVIDVKPDEIILNIGYKSDGIITRNEYTNEPNVDLTTVVKSIADKWKSHTGIGHKTCGYAQIDKGLKAYKCSHATAYELSACVLCLPCYKYTLNYDKKQKNYYTDCTNKAKLLSGNSKYKICLRLYDVVGVLHRGYNRVVKSLAKQLS